jgi:hypothetical protein
LETRFWLVASVASSSRFCIPHTFNWIWASISDFLPWRCPSPYLLWQTHSQGLSCSSLANKKKNTSAIHSLIP